VSATNPITISAHLSIATSRHADPSPSPLLIVRSLRIDYLRTTAVSVRLVTIRPIITISGDREAPLQRGEERSNSYA
jgi:hypothetical protein